MFFGFGFRGSEQKPPTVPSEPCSPPREQTFVKRNRKSQSFSTTKVVRFLDGLAQKIPVLGETESKIICSKLTMGNTSTRTPGPGQAEGDTTALSKPQSLPQTKPKPVLICTSTSASRTSTCYCGRLSPQYGVVLQQTGYRPTFPLHHVRSALHPVLSLLHHLRSPVLSLLPLSFLLLAQDFDASPIFIIHQQENRPSDRRQNQPRKGGCRWRWHCRQWVCLGFGTRRFRSASV